MVGRSLNGKNCIQGPNIFIEGRQTLDAALVANEAVDSILRSNKGVVL